MQKRLFDSGWEYNDKGSTFLNPLAQWQPVTLPHDAAIGRPRSRENPTRPSGGYAWSGVITYRKKFTFPYPWRGQSVQLEFEGVYMNAVVMVNGSVAAFHPYGYTSFLVDITPYLVFGAENVLTVEANNSAQPNSRWYSGTGIYRHVWLRLSSSGVYLKPWSVSVTTPHIDPAAATLSVSAEIANTGSETMDATLRSKVMDRSGNLIAQGTVPLHLAARAVTPAGHTLTVAVPHLWSLEDPHLYNLGCEVLVGGEVVDADATPFGIRSIAVDAQHGFRLNGAPLKLKGGCIHHDHGLLGSASYDRAEERKVELMKSAGYNAIRSAHNPPAPALLDACDRLGMLVIDETFDCWRMGKNPDDYHLYFEDWWQRDTAAMVLRDRNHPSIVMWSIGNEVGERTGDSDGYAWCRKQADYVRSLDNTRFITSAVPALFEELTSAPPTNPEDIFELLNFRPADPQHDRWGTVTRPFFNPLDVGGYNYLYKRYEFDRTNFPGRVICGTETFPHQAYATWDATLRLPNVIGDFVWTAIDYLGESGIGMVSIDDPTPFFAKDPWPFHVASCGDIDICGFKRPQSFYRDILWGVRPAPYLAVLPPELVGRKLSFNPWGWEPVSERWEFPGWEGKPTRVDVYSASDEVELLVNGISAGRRPSGAASQNKASFEVTYAPGKIEAVAYTGGQETGRFALATPGAPAGIRLTPDRPAIHAAPEDPAGMGEYYAPADLAYVTVEIVDQAGTVVQSASPEVSFEIHGPGELIALGSADPLSEELYVDARRKAFAGRLMAVVCSRGAAGAIRLAASAAGLSPAETVIMAM